MAPCGRWVDEDRLVKRRRQCLRAFEVQDQITDQSIPPVGAHRTCRSTCSPRVWPIGTCVNVNLTQEGAKKKKSKPSSVPASETVTSQSYNVLVCKHRPDEQQNPIVQSLSGTCVSTVTCALKSAGGSCSAIVIT